MAADEYRAMAFKRLFLGAHESHPVTLCSLTHPVQAPAEQIAGGQALVLHFAFLVAGGILAARSEFLSQENVLDAVFTQESFELFAVELGIHSAVRMGTYVAKHPDIM